MKLWILIFVNNKIGYRNIKRHEHEILMDCCCNLIHKWDKFA